MTDTKDIEDHWIEEIRTIESNFDDEIWNLLGRNVDDDIFCFKLSKQLDIKYNDLILEIPKLIFY